MPAFRESNTDSLRTKLIGVSSIREAAVLLGLGRTGLEIDPQIMEACWERVADAAEYLGATPDDIQAVLEIHEPSLAIPAVR